MKYLIYISSAVALMNEDELAGILQKSRINNQQKNLTGILLYSQGTFMQVLEGDETQLNETFEKIKEDSRHKGVIVLVSDDLERRNFGDWSMAFSSVQAKNMAGLEGYFNPDNQGVLNQKFKGNHPSIAAIKSFLEANPV